MRNAASFLVTGFEPFAGDSENPSRLLLDWIRSDSDLNAFFETELLPVVFAEAPQKVLKRKDLERFIGIIHFGLAAGRTKVSLERVGLNWIETSIADNSGAFPKAGVIDPQAEKVYFTRAPLEKIKTALQDQHLPVEISLSAGGYVCNYLYFEMLKSQLKPWVLFIHVPYLDEQVKGKNPEPFSLRKEQFLSLLTTLKETLEKETLAMHPSELSDQCFSEEPVGRRDRTQESRSEHSRHFQ